MAFKKFADFLNEQKNKLPEKTEEPKAKGSKLPSTYHAKGADKDCGLVTADDNRGIPLGDRGSPGMDPKKNMPMGEKPAGAPKKLKSSGKMPKKTESFLNSTAKLSNAQFTANLLEDHKLAKPKLQSLEGRHFTPEPAETLRYVVGLALKNEAMMSRLVREMKRADGLEKLVNELLNHGETYAVVAEAAQNDSRISRKLTEAVADPRGGGGSPAGPSGATAGKVPTVKNGGMNASSEAEEMPGNLLDDDDEEKSDDDDTEEEENDDDTNTDDDEEEESEDDEDEGGQHHHFHIHHHGSNGGGKKMMPPPPDLKP